MMPSKWTINIYFYSRRVKFWDKIIAFDLYVLRVNLLAISQLVTLVNSMSRRSFNFFGELVLTSRHVSFAYKG